MLKGFKIRIYPTKDQEQKFRNHIGACRFIWNYMLAYQEENYANGGKYLSAFDMMNLLSPMKKLNEYTWLNEISSASLTVVCRDVDKAYKAFFKKTRKHPRFKSRKRSKFNQYLHNSLILNHITIYHP